MIHNIACGRERIIGVAVKSGGFMFTKMAPARHHECLRMAIDAWGEDREYEQGFLTSLGRYVGREEAKEIAEDARQMKPRNPGEYDGDLLFSEEVW